MHFISLYIIFSLLLQDLCVREMKVHTTVGDIQIDNQEFPAGGYDFPVVMVMQKPQTKAPNFVMSQDARKLVEKARSKGCAGDLTVVIDTNSHVSLGNTVCSFIIF